MRIGILSAGGDCPGINATIRGVGKTAIVKYGMEVLGFTEGFRGLLNKEYINMDEKLLSGLLTMGGTILGTSREKPFKKKSTDTIDDKPEEIKKNYKELGLDALICIGGNGTQKTANKLAKEGLNIIGIPKTIDNDIYGTDQTFGFDSALNIATDAIDRLHTTANSHRRVMVIEIMGHSAGWLTLHAGIAGGGDVILVPEIEYDIYKVAAYLQKRANQGKPFSIVVVAEGIKTEGKQSAAPYIAQEIREITGMETRETILGYVQRGGSPTPYDRIFSTNLGAYATDLAYQGIFGKMVALRDGKITHVDLDEVGGKTRLLTPDNELIVRGRGLGVCFGN